MYKKINVNEYIVKKFERTGQLFTLKVINTNEVKKAVSDLEENMITSKKDADKNKVVYGIVFGPKIIIFLRLKEESLQKRNIETSKRDLDKKSPAFEQKFMTFLKDPGDMVSWDNLFDRTDIIDEFYILYSKAKKNLLDNIKGIYDDIEKEEFADELLMQILIIWYLQEKEFLDSNKKYLIDYFLKYKDLGYKNYYNFLKSLFDAMMNEPDDGIYRNSKKLGKIVVTGPAPFINDNLKEVTISDNAFYIIEKTSLIKKSNPNNLIQVPILNFFESRDWTEGNIDEFVLGAIFEKLMTRDKRKESGAFYTPEKITKFICENSITPYLTIEINKKFNYNYNSLYDFFEKNDQEECYIFLFEKLSTIKILDPTCGSGHFLETAIEVLVKIYEQMYKKISENNFSNEKFTLLIIDDSGVIKNEKILKLKESDSRILKIKFFIIISMNIYGVDILPNAIKIAKARLFLNLAKHFNKEKKITIRFPNIHFNLRPGNSLIGFSDLTLFKSAGQESLNKFFQSFTKNLFLSDLDDNILNYIRKIDEKLKTIAYSLIKKFQSENNQEITFEKLQSMMKLRNDLIRILIISLNTEISLKIKRIIDIITYNFKERLDTKYLEILKIDNIKFMQDNQKIFHWIMEFSEVFNNNGFNIILGNPPYIRYHLIDKEEITLYKKKYTFSSAQFDIFTIILERSYDLLAPNGYFGFIIPALFLRGLQYEKCREFFLNEVEIKNIVQLGDGVFKDVVMPTCIFLFCRNKPKGNSVIFQNNTSSLENDKIIIKQEELKSIIGKPLDGNASKILLKAIKYSIPFGNIMNKKTSTRGIEIGRDRLKREKITSDDIPVLSGENIRGFIPLGNSYISSETFEEFKKDSNIFKAPKIMIRETGAELMGCYDVKGLLTLRTIHNIHLSNTNLNILYIIGLLNSKLFQKIFELAFKQEGGTFPKIRKKQEELLPIRKIRFGIDKGYKKIQMDELQSFYKQFIKNYDNNMILEKINNFLIKDENGSIKINKEESEIIHDFIVFLVEKVICLGNQIEELSVNFLNKFNIQKILVTDIKFVEFFMKPFKKFLNKVGIDPSNTDEINKIKENFNEISLKIKSKINEKNIIIELIDEIIFRLYNLSEEEIKIIQSE